MSEGESIAVCPGSFDPITLGHIDIIRRSAEMFDKVIVVVMSNYTKQCTFTPEKRVEMIHKALADFDNVLVDSYDGLLANYTQEKKATAIIKGLRAMSDFEYEFQMSLANKKLNPDVETLFMTTSTEYMYLSSSMVRQIASMHGDVSSFVPNVILNDIAERFGTAVK